MRNDADGSEGEEDPAEPNPDFLKAFDNLVSFEVAADFIHTWFTKKENNRNMTDFATDFPGLLQRGLYIRRILTLQRAS
jgi:hypothetical protein